MRIAQIMLDKSPINKSKNFLKELWRSQSLEGARIFDMLDGTQLRRRNNPEMNLEKFLDLNWAKRHVRLQIGSPKEDRIVYCAIVYTPDRIDNFAWLECPLTVQNYEEISRIYELSYREKLEVMEK